MCGVVLAIAAASAAPPAPAAAAKLTATPVEVRHALFVAGDVDRMSRGARATREIVLERLLQRMYVIAPRLESGTAVTAVRRLAAALPRRLPAPGALEAQAPNERILTILTALDTPSPKGVAGEALTQLLRGALIESADGGAAGGQFTVSADELATMTDGTFSPSATLADTADLADRVAGFARARDALWGKAARESVSATSAELLARNPALRSEQMKPLTDLIAPDGSISTTTAAVQAIEGSGVRAMSRTVSEGIAAIDSIASDADSNAAASARSSTLAAAGASTTMAAALIATRNRETAQKVATVAKAVYTLGDVVNRYVKTANGGAPAGALGAVGKAALTGNFVLAAVGIASAILGGPSNDELILQQLDAIQQQIRDFQAAVDRRFDAVSAQVSGVKTQLDHIDVALRGLQQRMADLQAAVTRTDADVRSVRDEVVKVQVSLDRVEADLYRIAEADRNQALWQTINFALGYRERSARGLALPGVELQRAEATFFTFATSTAADEVAEPSAGRSYAIDDLVAELDRVPLEGNLDFLRVFPSAAGWVGFAAPLTEDKVANARHWAVAARAHAELLAENPGRVTSAQLGRLARIVDEGRKLERLVASIGARDAGTRTGSSLFDDLLDHYRSAFGLGDAPAPDSLLAAIRDTQREYLAPLTGPTPDVIYGEKLPILSDMPLRFDPWGGPAQGGTIPDRVAQAQRCETGAGFDPARTLPVPNRYAYRELFFQPNKNILVQRGPFELPPEVRLARDLGLGQVRNCWRADYTGPQFPLGVPAGESRILRVHIVWQWIPTGGSTPRDVMSMSGELPAFEPVSDPPLPDDVLFEGGMATHVLATELRAREVRQPRPDQHPASLTTNDALIAAVRADVEAELKRHQIEIYRRVAGGIRGSGPLHDAAVRLTGIRRLMDAYIAVGLPGAANDDRLQALRPLDEEPPPAPRLPDRRISSLYLDATDPAKTPATDLRVTLAGESRRVDAFEAELRSIIGGPRAAGAAARTGAAGAREALPIVRSTLTRLAATNAVIRARGVSR